MAVLKYYNTTTSAWEYIAASTTANFTTWKKTASGGETSVSGTDDNAVTLSYTVGLEQVFINGVLQVRGTDYVATTGTSVTGLSALVASDIVTVVCYAPFNVANTIAPTVVDAKGDLIVGTAADTVGRLAVGSSNGQLLSVDSSTASGLKWANPGMTLIKTQSFSAVASSSVDDVFSTTYDNYRIILDITDFTSDATVFAKLRVSGTDSSASYYSMAVGALAAGGTTTLTDNNTSSGVIILRGDSGTDNVYGFTGDILNPFKVLPTKFAGSTVCTTPTGGIEAYNVGGLHFVSTSYTSLNLIAGAGNMTGSVSVYGYNK